MSQRPFQRYLTQHNGWLESQNAKIRHCNVIGTEQRNAIIDCAEWMCSLISYYIVWRDNTTFMPQRRKLQCQLPYKRIMASFAVWIPELYYQNLHQLEFILDGFP